MRRLIEVCNELEDLELPIDASCDGLVYREDGEIIGYVGLDGGRVVESTGMVHPEHRRRGIGKALLNALIELCREQGSQTCYVVIDEASPSGKSFVSSIGARYHISEYRMLLDCDQFLGAREWEDRLDLVPATIDDLELFSSVMATAFGDPVEPARGWLEVDMRRPNRRFWIARKDGEPIGTVRSIGTDADVYITALGVLSSYRGRGYGRQILSRITEMLMTEPWDQILIEVETENSNALGLYRSVGFEATRTYSFNEIDL